MIEPIVAKISHGGIVQPKDIMTRCNGIGCTRAIRQSANRVCSSVSSTVAGRWRTNARFEYGGVRAGPMDHPLPMQIKRMVFQN